MPSGRIAVIGAALAGILDVIEKRHPTVTCPSCHGYATGIKNGEPWKCPECGGLGNVHVKSNEDVKGR